MIQTYSREKMDQVPEDSKQGKPCRHRCECDLTSIRKQDLLRLY